MYPSPYRIDIYDVNLAYQGSLTNPLSLTATPRHNEVSTLEFSLPTTDTKLPLLMAKGARVVLFRHGEWVMSGYVDVISGQGPTISGIVSISVTGDLAIAQKVLGWQVPENDIDNQDEEWWELTGPLETVAKTVFEINAVDRLGMAITIMPDLGRGPEITFKTKMEPLSELFFPLIDQNDWGVKIYQVESEMFFDVYECTEYTIPLTEASGVIQAWSFSSASPAATHIVMQGSTPPADPVLTPAEGEELPEPEEKLPLYHQGIATARAANWGIKEIFITGSDLPDTDDPGYDGAVSDALDEALADNNERSGISVSLSETEDFHYGPGGIQVGQLVTFQIGIAERTDILRECVLTFTYEDGDKAVPTIGEVSDDPDRTLSKFLRKLRRSINEIRLAR